jgi:uncharacterized membrane protein
MSGSDSESLPSRSEPAGPDSDRLPQENVTTGGVSIVWEDRWHEEEIFANRLSFYILAQSFLLAASVTATLSASATSRWLPVALAIDLAGLALTVIFWYALTENLRRLEALKNIVAEGSVDLDVAGYREIGAIRAIHHERRAQRRLPFPLAVLPRQSPTWWLAHSPVLIGFMWLTLLAVSIITAS